MSQLSIKSNLAKQPNLLLAWAYARRELVFISWALMEVSLITPLSLAILPWADAWWGRQRLFVSFLLLMMSSFYLARFVTWLKLPARDQKSILLVTGTLLLFLALRNINYQPESLFDFKWIGQSFRNLAVAGSNLWLRDLFLLGLTALSWWRGMTLLNRDVDVVRVGERFRFGGLFLAPLAILLASLRLDWSVLPFLLFFFVISLTAVALTRAESTEKEQTAVLASLSPRWLGMITTFSIMVTFLGSATAVLFSGLSKDALGQWLAPVWNALRWGGQTIALTASYIISPLLDTFEAFIQLLIRLFQDGFNILFEANPDAPPPPDGGNGLLEAYNEWFLNQEPGGTGLFSNVNWRTAVSIIRIYQQMIAMCGEFSTPRGDSETPYEYLSTLETVWPDQKRECQLITHAYVKVRYGEFPETKEAFEAIKKAWKQVQKTAVIPAHDD